MGECLFCQIAAGQIPAKIVYEDELVLAFEDVNPQAPVHILLIPRQHLDNILELSRIDEKLCKHFFTVIDKLAQKYGLKKKGNI